MVHSHRYTWTLTFMRTRNRRGTNVGDFRGARQPIGGMRPLCSRPVNRWIIVVVTALALSVVAGEAHSAQGEPSRDETGAIIEEGRIPVDSIRVGDCFDDPSDPQDLVDSLRAVPCSRPHDNETSDRFDLPDGTYPGDEETDSLASQGCLASFEAYVGVSYRDSELGVSHLTPTEEAWNDGDREVICFVFQPTGEKMIGSVGSPGAAVDDSPRTAAEDTVSGPAAFVFGVVALALSILLLAAMWRIFTKAGEAGWKSLIPIWNLIVLLRIAGRPAWWVILLLVPFVNIVVLIIMYVDLAKAFGKGIGFALGLLLLGFIFLPLLAFGDAQYRGRLPRSN